jgi:hypothetical protein
MKKALLIGNNYPDTEHPLRGCVNDVVAINEILVNNLGFDDPKLIRMLTDKSATTDNILERLNWLIQDAVAGDVLYFHYSGHGAQLCDLDYNTLAEPDGLDEIIVPYDINWRDKLIKDKDLKRIFSKLPIGVNLTVTLDCCHSGDGLRGDFQPPVELMGAIRSRSITAPVDIANRAYGLNLEPKEKTLVSNTDQIGLLIAGCKSYQTSADAWMSSDNKYYGALTHTMIMILKSHNYQISYQDLVLEVSARLLQDGYHQQPELNGNSELFANQFLYAM